MIPKVGDILVYREGHLRTKVTSVFTLDEVTYMSEESIWVRDGKDGGNRVGMKWPKVETSIIGQYCDISKESRINNLLNVIDSSEAQTDY